MQMFSNSIILWTKGENGEVSIAWMFLTATLIAMSVAVLNVLGGGATELASEMETEMEQTEMGPHFRN